MKNLNLIIIALSILLFASCQDDIIVDDSPTVDFTGFYEGAVVCVGPMAAENDEIVGINIIKAHNDFYNIDLGDELIITAEQRGSTLMVDRQSIGDIDVDYITIKGEFTSTSEGVLFTFIHNVDEEGESDCSFELIKK